MKALGVIPARLGSTRLKEKVLKPIAGKPMIQHVWERAAEAHELSEVVVACDDSRVQACAKAFGARVMMTRSDHPNGSSRVAEVARASTAQLIVNIQGDEPLIHPQAIDRLVHALNQDSGISVATLAVRQQDEAAYQNPNVVKVVCDANGNALYFSRSPLPFYREPKLGGPLFLKHLGIYGYRREFLLDFVTWPLSRLEEAEKLEQLRILEKGIAIRVVETPFDSLSVDDQDDLELVEAKMNLNISRTAGNIYPKGR